MTPFANSFLLLPYQLALGGLFALAATPFHELARGFYKSTGGVLFVLGLLGFLGKVELLRRSLAAGIGPAAGVDMTLHALFLVLFALYLFSLWGENAPFRARVFAGSLFVGVAGLWASSAGLHRAPFFSLESLLYPVSLILSAFLLGGVTVGMLIGHWYLIDTGQSIEPFIRIFKFFVIALIAQALSFVVFPPLLYLFGSAATLSGMKKLWEEHLLLLSARLVVTQAGPLILSYMIWQTLKIPHTMAATGLFYIALLGVFVGEILGRQILALTSLPF